ncbi:MAG: BlaI/MecI/CopY family transcriptional regulator [Candidatus Methylacidiphilales bacterium]|nr:BlaI/MecI/CopY family transcriptional regulator [Candidatus Methylacidiphilales bacterium]
MSHDAPLDDLSRRERQIMDILYAMGTASAAEVQEKLPDAPGYSAVRSALRLLEKKGLVTHQRDGLKFVFAPSISGKQARETALQRVIATFFRNSAMEAVQSLLSSKDLRITEKEAAEIEELIRKSRERK